MLSLLRKEISSYFSSAIGYIAILVFLIVIGLILWVFPGGFNILEYGYSNIDGLFVVAPFVFLFLIPAVTMRTFAEEKKSGTIELLYTKPIKSISIVMAKYLACCFIVFMSLLPTLIFYFTVYFLGSTIGNIDSGAVFGTYAGLFLLGMSFAAIGVFCSSLTDNQIVAFVMTALISTFLYLGIETMYQMRIFGNASLFVKNLGMQTHYASLSRGVVDTRDVIYYLSVIFVFLMFTVVLVDRRK